MLFIRARFFLANGCVDASRERVKVHKNDKPLLVEAQENKRKVCQEFNVLLARFMEVITGILKRFLFCTYFQIDRHLNSCLVHFYLSF